MVPSSTGTGGFLGQPQKRRSRWLWWVYLGAGLMSCIGFIVVAVKVRNRRFVRAAVVSVIACIMSFVIYDLWPPDEVKPSAGVESSTDATATFSNGMWIVTGIWIWLIVYGHVLNHDYKKFLGVKDDEERLRWHSTRDQAQARYAPPTGAGASAPPHVVPSATAPEPSAPSIDHLIVQADQYLTTQPPGNEPRPMPPNVSVG